MRKRERELLEKALRKINVGLDVTETIGMPCHDGCYRSIKEGQMLLHKVLKEDEREKARLTNKGRRVVNK